MNPVVREARVDDASAIARIHVVGWQTAYRGIVSDALLANFSIPARTLQWEKWLRDASPGKFVVEADGLVAGWAWAGSCRDEDRKGPTFGELYAIYIEPAYWRQGLGTLLHAQVERELMAQRFKDVSLWVLEANRPGRAFYEKHGHRPDGARKNAFHEGPAVPELRYLKAL